MSVYRDWFDWLRGYPFEVARLERLRTTNSNGINELVLSREAVSPAELDQELRAPHWCPGLESNQHSLARTRS